MRIRSIKQLLLFAFVLVLIVMILSILTFSWLNRWFYSDMDVLIEDSSKFIALSDRLKDESDTFEQFGRTEDAIAVYEDAVSAADSAMEVLLPIVPLDRYTAMFYRSLTVMRDYEAELREEMFATDAQSSAYFALRNRLIRANGLMLQQSNHMQHQYMQYMYWRYAELVSEYRIWQTRAYNTVLLVSCAIIIFLAVKLRKVILEMRLYTARAADMEAGRLDLPDINPCGLAELDVFAAAFNAMKSTIRQNIEELRDKADMETQLKLLRQSQFRSLQNNMNPHFLFNTLNIISRLALFEGGTRTVALMESVAKILRYNMSNLERLVPLREELSIAYAYIEIQKTRFGEWISFDVYVEDSGLPDKYLIPPMILQPIIENSIIHGFKNKSKDCKLSLRLSESGGNAMLTVKDNGGGMSADEIAAAFDKQDSTGLRNIKERLDLTFEREGLIRIEGKKPGGLAVTVTLPA